ncbi:MAG: 3-hydroxyacyl-CoA dehydrogenase NAD-binding domain-containing protein [Salinirussus sp.]
MEFTDIETITVLGAGTMGHGIAELAALAGYEVRLRDVEEDLVQEGFDNIEWSLEKLVENDQVTSEEADAALQSITPMVDLEAAVDGTDVVIEAIVEDMDIKKQVYGELSEAAPSHAIFASNTSSLSITELATATDRPEQVCGMHFFNPPVRMELVEVISGGETADETVETIADLAEALDKTPIHVHKDAPGFVVNRVLVPLLNEACWLMNDDVATIEEIDATTKYDLGLPMGAFELADLTGNDVNLHVLRYMHDELGDAYEPAPILVDKVENDELGRKTDKGFYDYEDGGVDIPVDAARDDVRRRLVGVMANEVGKILQDDIADLEAIEQGMKLGAAFPEGPAALADDEGLDTLVETLESAHNETGAARYVVADGLREAAESGGFHGGEEETASTVYETLRVDVDVNDQVGTITLDRPHAMNTVTPELLEEFARAVEELEANEDVRALLIRGAGDRAFSAGADAVGMAGGGEDLDPIALSREGQETWGRLEESPLPVVAAIDGYALGGGMELAACADIRIASERATFGQPEIDLAIIPGWGATQRLANIIGEGRAREIMLTGEHYDPDTMADYGFVTEVVEPEDIDTRARELAADLAAGPPLAMAALKRAILAGRDDTEAGLEVESQAFGHLVRSEDFMEGVAKFQSDEEPEFEGR